MICPNCKNEITTVGSFCPHCGFRLSQQVVFVGEPPKKKHTGLLIGIIAGAAVLLCIALFIVLLSKQKKDAPVVVDTPSATQTQTVEKDSKIKLPDLIGKKEADPAAEYAAALDLLERKEYAQAQEALAKLEDYEDAKELAAYAGARLLLAQEKYEEAKAAFDALGDVRDAKQLSDQCKNELTYQEAVAKKAAGDYEAAAKLFSKIPGVKDADQLAADCWAQVANDKITAALDKQDWAGALALLEGKDGKNYPNYASVVQNCRNHVDYAQARKAMDAKRFYTAYKLFSALGDYEDARQQASLCQRPMPNSKELYRNKNFDKEAIRLNITNSLTSGANLYVRIYDSTGNVLVSTTFVQHGKAVALYLPDETFRFNLSCSRDSWYGEEEAFGADGTYATLGYVSLNKLGRGYYYIILKDLLEYKTISWEDF